MSAGFGKAVREARIKKGWTLREFARRLGVSAPFVCDLEHGRRGTWRIDDISKLLGVELEKLRRLSDRYDRDEVRWLEAHPKLMEMLRQVRRREANDKRRP